MFTPALGFLTVYGCVRMEKTITDVHIPFLNGHIRVIIVFRAQSTHLNIFEGLGERQRQVTNQWNSVVQL